MLRGQRVLLRPHRRADLAVLQPILRDDVATVAVMEDAGWLPRSLERAEARFDKRLADDPPTEEIWLMVQAHDDPVEEAIGEAGLWGIDLHRRQAHLGVVLARTRRGSGLGRDVVRVLCDYAFRLRGLHRLQVDTVKLNTPMRAAATATTCGRRSRWWSVRRSPAVTRPQLSGTPAVTRPQLSGKPHRSYQVRRPPPIGMIL
jgi:RimJ/RimL family protein N-acetyltransferase